MLLNYFLLTTGLFLLYFGADWLVRGSSSLARSMNISPLVIGLTVVAFGTSAPEMVVSAVASLQDKSMIAIGNVVGSNICNIALVLGTTALIMPIRASHSVVKRDIPIMLLVSVYLLLLSFNSEISRLEGLSLFTGIILYTLFNYHISKKEAQPMENSMGKHVESELENIGYVESRAKQAVMIFTGIAGVLIGAQVLINNSVIIMKTFGVSEKFIGLTIVALGTSIPELATSVVAAMRKELDISIGNLVGSNVFNLLSVIGITALIRPIPISGGFIESGLIIDYFVMMFISFLPWVMMKNNYTIARKNGLALLCCYVFYITYLVITG